MDILRAEIAKKRKATELLINEVNPNSKIGNTRFIRQGDLKRYEEEKILEAQRKLDECRSKSTNIQMEEKLNSKIIEPERNSVVDFASLSVDQVKQRLRFLRQPITLFGETDEDRLARYVKVQKDEQQDDDFRLGSGHNVPNPFLNSKQNQGEPEDENDDEDDDDHHETSQEEGHETDTSDNKIKTKPVENILYSQIQGLAPEKLICKYFRSLLKSWEWDLNARDDREKLTAKGKKETKTQKQCKDYIRPLFKLCKNKTLSEDIRDKLVLMVGYCENGNFRAAYDEYLKTAIGNAAWPIGLTMVGIHERSGREKISSSKIAHVMNNECQRKYLTSIKRLITYAQSKRPDVPPSMKVM